ncbi:MAG: HAMP domain-containing sensor histidine kinase [Polyangia bacterium]
MRLRSFLLGVNLLIFVLPLGGLLGSRVLDRQLARQTHGELAALGSALVVSYRAALLAELPVEARPAYGRPTTQPDPLRLPDVLAQSLEGAPVLPPARPATTAELPADPIAHAAGRVVCDQVQALREATRAGARLLDFRGTVVCSSGGEREESLAERPEVVRALAGQVASSVRRRSSSHPSPPLASPSRETGWRVFLALPVVNEADGRVLGAVVVSRTPLSPLKALWQDRHALAAAVALLLGVVVLVTLWTQAVILRPLRRLLVQAKGFTRGPLPAPPPGPDPARSPPAPVESPLEVGEISRALSEMAGALLARTRYLKDFTTALSHELKTPLTSMRGAVELLQEHGAAMSPAQRDTFLRQLAADTARMERLVRRTLDQVRADAQPGTGRCDVAATLTALCARHADDTLRIELQLEPGLGTAALGDEALETLLAPLLDNARLHGRAGRPQVAVRLSARRDGSTLHIELTDDGPGLPAEHAGRLFQPFFTTAREQGGTGLGLHFARALAEALGGTLALDPASPGARFVLTLPG